MDAIYTFADYSDDSRPRIMFPARTGRRTTYTQWLDHQHRFYHNEAIPPPQPGTPRLTPAFVNHGRWLWQCPDCLTAVQVSLDQSEAHPCCCPACFCEGFVKPSFPDNKAAIDAELLLQPGYRWNAPFRNWEPGWSLEYLQERTAKAQALLAAGATHVRAASIGSPRTWSVGELLTAANMNTYIREIQKDLIGTNGPVEFLSAIVPESMSTVQRDALAALDGTLLFNSTLNRLQVRESGAWTSGVKIDRSVLFGGNNEVTLNHNLGVQPKSFQLLYERVKNTPHGGHGLGAILYSIPTTQPNPDQNVYGVWDITTTSYKVRLYNDVFGGTFPNRYTISSTGGPLRIGIDNKPDSQLFNGGWGARMVAIG